MELKHFKGCKNLDEVKVKYRVLSKRYHPDKGGDPKVMQDINAENDYIKKHGLSAKVDSEKLKIEFEGFVFEFNASHGLTQEILDQAMIQFEKYLNKKNPLMRPMLRAAFKAFVESYK
ncbi:MAG: hypothetical protein WAQ28_03435 [Bacteroidia bacterium]